MTEDDYVYFKRFRDGDLEPIVAIESVVTDIVENHGVNRSEIGEIEISHRMSGKWGVELKFKYEGCE